MLNLATSTDGRFRVPGFLATSFAEKTAVDFMKMKQKDGMRGIRWNIRLDSRGDTMEKYRCRHAYLVRRDAKTQYDIALYKWVGTQKMPREAHRL